MTKTKLFIITFFTLMSFSVLANSYTGFDGWLDMMSDFITDFWAFFDTDIPEFIIRFYAWLIEWVVLASLKLELEMIKFSWLVAKQILENFNVTSQVSSALSALPADVRAAVADMRALDAFNIIINAYVTRYVMRFF
ncbi:hypothetical protein N474_25525 [Pseudoalteromonas luteoviolacea CPMOR-2]|uniref:DUF2523 family protein n=1 Tax=Pseudoalteromonas luteoviolacea TaxID=43657 RepID=UPI0007B09569|nr:DUF2523 family protein [Pseudoalteromonas luteoviolacea]KZN58413.1 hypothetical protein N474_25525 [Pseudoalteromonas luteoviolacea CPMOR-2]